MKVLIRAGISVAAAAGFCFVLSASAKANVVTPDSALQPASERLVSDPASSDGSQSSMFAPLEEAFNSGMDVQMTRLPDSEVAATPAPEQVVTKAPSSLNHRRTVSEVAGSPLDRAVQPLKAGFHRIGEYLGRVASACQVPLGSGAGGPVLFLGVLGVAVAFERRRVFGRSSAIDEAVPVFLFAQELTPPG